MVLFLAGAVPWVLWPAYVLLKACRIRFIVNVGEAVGDVVRELDNHFRMRDLGELDDRGRLVWIASSNHLLRASVALSARRFWWATSNDFLHALLLPLVVRYRDLTLDVGLTRWKIGLPEHYARSRPAPGQPFWRRIPKTDWYPELLEYFKRRQRSRGVFPLREEVANLGADASLAKLLNGRTERLALVHIKTAVGNSTAEPTDPETYLNGLDYLSDLGYQLVFVGRETMPDAFRRYGTLNYAASEAATLMNDFRLFALAHLALVGGSGIGSIAACLGKPYVFLNYWELLVPDPSEQCLCVPTLVQRRSGEFLTFSEQIQLYMSLLGWEGHRFPEEDYFARNATADEIRIAVEELTSSILHPERQTAAQQEFARLDEYGFLAAGGSRVSEYFLNKHRALLQ